MKYETSRLFHLGNEGEREKQSEAISLLEDKIRKDPPRASNYKKVKYLIRVKERIFEVGIILNYDYFWNESFFIGLIEQESMKTHLGFKLKLKDYNSAVNLVMKNQIRIGFKDIYSVKV